LYPFETVPLLEAAVLAPAEEEADPFKRTLLRRELSFVGELKRED